ncbi:PTS fructose transporter subunit IIC [Olsenella porci]|uniref:PTS fructose-like transporter subunit EIIC n=1 Tax=Olsenella porci TaxID=2652279 RepID=A0A6N7XLZ8_9ACTN|nr:fructose-specific PTS transporter subunit EIIC [Olsenella porci]MST71994.1 PTS fructose-like transporter subunit EIIC [Olsenella porci]
MQMTISEELRGIFKETRTHLMGGVSYMIPVVVSGGILYALATMMSMSSVTTSGSVEASNVVVSALSQIGGVGLGLMVPVLTAFIAFSIADRPGIAPGIICGQLAVNVGSGFIGGIIAGLLAGTCAQLLKRIRLPKSMESLKSILIIPIVSTLIVGVITLYVVGGPCAWLLSTLTTWLTGMTGSSAIIVGAICGAMICTDLGGPINKVAYSTGVAVVGTEVLSGGNCTFFGPIAVAICLPSFACGIGSFVLRKKFSDEDRDAGIGAIAMGVCGISEAAISYTAEDPAHMIPINIVSGAFTGAVAGALGVYCNAAWGGLVVLPVTSVLTYLLSLVIGIAFYLTMFALFKKDYVPERAEAEREAEAEEIDFDLEM